MPYTLNPFQRLVHDDPNPSPENNLHEPFFTNSHIN
jgi:hypothetical protein